MKKKTIKVLIATAVIAVTGIGATLALLNDTTQTATNVFKSDKAISVQLREPTWDGWVWSDPDGKATGLIPKTTSTDLGIHQAAAYVPGQNIPKNPTVKNNGDATNVVDTYVALKVQYFSSAAIQDDTTEMTYDDFKTAYLKESGLDFDTSWTKLNVENVKYNVYQYNSKLTVGNETKPLFTQVPLSLNLEPEENGKLPGFSIKVTAYAIQADNVSVAEAPDALAAFVTGTNNGD